MVQILYLLFLTGWFDAILIPPHEHRWTFKEGDVAVLSVPMPGAGFAYHFVYFWVYPLNLTYGLSDEKLVAYMFLLMHSSQCQEE